MFVDYVKITIKAGKGGDGSMAFRREKYVPDGGPAGGDGGKGGDVVFVADRGLNTLLKFRYQKEYQAENGENGQGSNKSGKSGKDLIITVPIGTIIREHHTKKILSDLASEGQEAVVAKGGKGGKGNQHFATSIRQAPRFAEPGQKGEEKELILELKVLADVGLVGFPNVGKSTFLSKVTNALPKIANYHFTTLNPNLGVVQYKDAPEFVIADIPGIIEGAHEGAGLGHRFLRHIERTRLMLHFLDASGSEGRDPRKDFEIINNELKMYHPQLAKRKQIVVLNKMDLIEKQEELEKLMEYFSQQGYEVFATSAMMQKGIEPLLNSVIRNLSEMEDVYIPLEEETETAIRVVDYDEEKKKPFEITKGADGVFYVNGQLAENMIRRVNFEDSHSMAYFQKIMVREGVEAELKKMGVRNGDSVVIDTMEFEYFE